MKLGRMIDNDKRQVPFEDELNRFIRTEVRENSYLYYFLLRPFDNYLAQKLCFQTGIIFIRVYVSVCVCVSVCLCVNLYIDYLKKFMTDLNEIWQDDV